MALVNSAVDGLFGAVVSGGAALGLWWFGRKRGPQLDDAWRKQADELDERLSKQYLGEISYLRRALTLCQAETKRLNQLLNKKRGDGDD